MSTPNLGLIDTLLSGRQLKGVRRRSKDDVAFVDLMFADGSSWSLVPNEGEEVTACLINIMKKSAPITKVEFDWPELGMMGLRFWSEGYLLLQIWTTHTETGGWPARLLKRKVTT